MYVAHRVVMRAAAVAIFAASGSLEWAASPSKAVVLILIDTAAGVALGAGEVVVTNLGRFYRRWRRWTRVRGILSYLDWVRRLHCNSTFPGCRVT